MISDLDHHQSPLAISSRVIDAAFAVLLVTMVVKVTGFLDQLPGDATVVRVLEQHRVVKRERLAAAYVDLLKKGSPKLNFKLIENRKHYGETFLLYCFQPFIGILQFKLLLKLSSIWLGLEIPIVKLSEISPGT